ncbi:AraC family transcriptional regulator [Pedobacter frigidisoli]|uniref:AraC family transcriptional regulator n=1 Tax=Pedobacter frigidisoli TaxID=2530455 RepID=A0A4V2MKY5_9SPHI|nr:AraC family transcriptional regulator [Pedobacter frigidisoli]TCD00017.1 AraC family transcriptional regulator [Pedobacter frigidisoli]
MDDALNYQLLKPEKSLADYVYCFSSLNNLATVNDAVVIPNGKIDLIFSKNADDRLTIALLGLETKPKYAKVDVINFFSISFNPLAIEYVFGFSVAEILNAGKVLPDHFWGFSIDDLNDFNAFCKKATQKIISCLPKEIDERKRKLFELIMLANGEISIKELAEKIFWTERQINRYFKGQFGLSLKAYCNILRFQASLQHIKEGKLYPQLNFTDQSHFIKEIKKLSGVSPKELFKNENDRFLQFLVYLKQ